VRPRLIEALDSALHTHVFRFVVPGPAVVYAVMVGVAILLFVRRCERSGLSWEHATGMALWASLAAGVGGRLFDLIQHLGYTLAHPSEVLALNGATVSFGVYIGGVLGALLYSRARHFAPLPYLDVFASVLGVGPLIGRWACFLNGDDYGRVSNVPWAVRFPHGSYPFLDHVQRGWISPMADLSLPVHPVQLYLSLNGLVLLLAFSALWKRSHLKPGVLFLLYWTAYSGARFALEFFRGDEDRGWIGVLSIGQAFSLLIAAACVACLALCFRGRLTTERAPRPASAAASAIPAAGPATQRAPQIEDRSR
jgi:phosphatidylglycerol:prolipoprotein diacylglycerol transferase